MRSIFSFFRNLFVKKTPAHSDPIVTIPPSDKPGFYIGRISGASIDEVSMIEAAIKIVDTVVKSPEFQEEVLTINFTSTNQLSNLKIYEAFTKSALVVNVEMFTGNWRQNHIYHTMGLDVGDGVVYANRVFVNDKITMASLIIHEMSHELGFHHVSAAESTSVPYRMNFILEKIAQKLAL